MTVSDGGVGAAVLVAGSGHLADRLEELLRSTRPVVGRVDVIHPGPLAPFEDALECATAAALYVVDDAACSIVARGCGVNTFAR